MNRRIRRICTAFAAILALLMSQLAVSAHVCEMAGMADVAVRLTQPSPGGCPELNTPNLCDQHCQFGQSAVDQGKPVPSLDLTSGPALHIQQPYPSPILAKRSPREMPLPPEPPPAIRFSVLRI
jgi:hypothetical protein